MTPTEPPLISVVIPTHNRANLVTAAAESVWQQTVRPIQLIIVDDGSTDNTRATIDDWAENHRAADFNLVYLYQPKSGGNPARNRGIENAAGDYIAFLDSDDLWHPHKLEKQLQVFQSGPESIGGVYCGLRNVDLKSGKVTHHGDRAYDRGDLLQQILIKDITAPTSTYLVKAEVFANVGGFDESLQARQDWDMWIRLASHYTIDCVEEPLVDFRDHDGPRTYSDPTREIRAYREILDKYRPLHRQFGWGTRQQIWASYYRRMARVYSHRNLSRRKAIGSAVASIAYWPFTFDSYAALIGIFVPANLRARLNRSWNHIFGKTGLAIRSH